jgi:ribosomal protein S18 acetylase RimI-like enzyme
VTARSADADVLSRIGFVILPLIVRRSGVLAGIALAVLHERSSIVFSVSVAPEHRRSGVATDLMRAWADAAGDRTLFLQVMDENTGGRAFYDALGFARSHGYHYRRAPR